MRDLGEWSEGGGVLVEQREMFSSTVADYVEL